jgi:hypothetical protein
MSRTRFRPYLALAAMLAIPAKEALATSPVEMAREQESAVGGSWGAATEAEAPASPLAIAPTLGVMASPLVSREQAVQIELREPEPGQQRDALAFDRQYQVDPQREAR